MNNRRSQRHLVILLIVWAAVAIIARNDLLAKLPDIRVSYHMFMRHSGGMKPFYDHSAALRDMAIAGSDRALRGLLMDSEADGANSYTQATLTVDCLRAVEDARFARTVDGLPSEDKERLVHYLSRVSDLAALAPLTHAALRIEEQDADALPLHDPGLIWP